MFMIMYIRSDNKKWAKKVRIFIYIFCCETKQTTYGKNQDQEEEEEGYNIVLEPEARLFVRKRYKCPQMQMIAACCRLTPRPTSRKPYLKIQMCPLCSLKWTKEWIFPLYCSPLTYNRRMRLDSHTGPTSLH